MSYTALYRKFRPQSFEDVRGQEHIVTTLKNQLKADRIGHAYLFCGTRGTGKTTIAKIFAKAVNCENPQDGSPCGECAMCKAIAAGSSMNVIEIDAASNNGVENVRTIIEEVAYPPVEGKYKVYIMDEAHMLSEGARNALLKTLEEPPKYVIFILATTEVPRIPITIMSRCQRYDFKRISIETIAGRMRELTDIEGIQVEDKALTYVAKAADGSMRDGLSLLDQCVAFHFGELLTYEKVLEILGAVDTEVFSRLTRCILADDIIGGMALVEEIVMQGRDLSQFVTDYIWYLRNLMLLKASDAADMEDLLNVSAEHLALLKEEAAQLEMNSILRYIDVFTELSGRLRFSGQKRIMLEMYLIRLMRPQMDTDEKAVLERVRSVEKKIEKGIPMAAASQAAAVVAAAPAEPKRKLEIAVPEDIEKVVRDWPMILGRSEFMLRGLLNKAKLSLGDNGHLLLCFTESVHAEALRNGNFKEQFAGILNEHIGKEVPFDAVVYDESREFDTQFADLADILNIKQIKVEVED
ncbi:MAG: DNA polymerase III subunit gamma/tau [Lachnospiraceae bacterium]|nr:DNA polymerase III subunit gamma/tau [Lachnospiraceae bacterium]